MKYVSIIITTIIFMLYPSVTMAKIISSLDGRATFETSAQWRYIRFPGDHATEDFLSISYDKDTCLTLKRSTFKLPYSNFTDISSERRSAILDALVQSHVVGMRNKGYNVFVTKSDDFGDGLAFAIKITKPNFNGIMMSTYYVKDSINYSYSMIARDDTVEEASEVWKTLRIDGMLYSEWLKE